MPNGLLLIDKPEGFRSADCVARVRSAFGKQVRIGHAGTLDSTASGLLILLLGTATRLSDHVMRLPKRYRALVRLGTATDTCDYSGRTVFRGDHRNIDETAFDRALTAFLGWRMQRPPEISALKRNGIASHKLARAGQSVNLEPRPVFIQSIGRVSRLRDGEAEIEVLCGKGTYIRSLVRDLGQRLGCGAHVGALRRLSVGAFRVEDGQSPEPELADMTLRPAREVGESFHRIVLEDEAERRILQGLSTPLAGAGRWFSGMVGTEQGLCAEGRETLSFVERLECDGTIFLRPRANIWL